MPKTKVNVINPATDKRKIGALNNKTGIIKLGSNLFQTFSKKYLQTCGEVIEFETYKNGKRHGR